MLTKEKYLAQLLTAPELINLLPNSSEKYLIQLYLRLELSKAVATEKDFLTKLEPRTSKEVIAALKKQLMLEGLAEDGKVKAFIAHLESNDSTLAETIKTDILTQILPMIHQKRLEEIQDQGTSQSLKARLLKAMQLTADFEASMQDKTAYSAEYQAAQTTVQTAFDQLIIAARAAIVNLDVKAYLKAVKAADFIATGCSAILANPNLQTLADVKKEFSAAANLVARRAVVSADNLNSNPAADIEAALALFAAIKNETPDIYNYCNLAKREVQGFKESMLGACTHYFIRAEQKIAQLLKKVTSGNLRAVESLLNIMNEMHQIDPAFHLHTRESWNNIIKAYLSAKVPRLLNKQDFQAIEIILCDLEAKNATFNDNQLSEIIKHHRKNIDKNIKQIIAQFKLPGNPVLYVNSKTTEQDLFNNPNRRAPYYQILCDHMPTMPEVTPSVSSGPTLSQAYHDGAGILSTAANIAAAAATGVIDKITNAKNYIADATSYKRENSYSLYYIIPQAELCLPLTADHYELDQLAMHLATNRTDRPNDTKKNCAYYVVNGAAWEIIYKSTTGHALFKNLLMLNFDTLIALSAFMEKISAVTTAYYTQTALDLQQLFLRELRSFLDLTFFSPEPELARKILAYYQTHIATKLPISISQPLSDTVRHYNDDSTQIESRQKKLEDQKVIKAVSNNNINELVDLMQNSHTALKFNQAIRYQKAIELILSGQITTLGTTLTEKLKGQDGFINAMRVLESFVIQYSVYVLELQNLANIHSWIRKHFSVEAYKVTGEFGSESLFQTVLTDFNNQCKPPLMNINDPAINPEALNKAIDFLEAIANLRKKVPERHHRFLALLTHLGQRTAETIFNNFIAYFESRHLQFSELLIKKDKVDINLINIMSALANADQALQRAKSICTPKISTRPVTMPEYHMQFTVPLLGTIDAGTFGGEIIPAYDSSTEFDIYGLDRRKQLQNDIKDYAAIKDFFYTTIKTFRQHIIQDWIQITILQDINCSNEREQFYSKIYTTCEFFKNIQDLLSQAFASSDLPEDLYAKTLAELKIKLTIVYNHLVSMLQPPMRPENYAAINVWTDNLIICKDKFSSVPEISDYIADIQKNLAAQLNFVLQQMEETHPTEQSDAAQVIVAKLITLQSMAEEMSHYKTHITVSIGKVLEGLKSAHLINDVGTALKGHDSPAAKQIISSQPAFKGLSLFMYNKAKSQVTVKEVLANLKGGLYSVNSTLLEQYYDSFQTVYQQLIKRGLDDAQFIKTLSTSILSISHLKDEQDTIIHYLAHLFAYWTLQNSEHYKNMLEDPSLEIKEEDKLLYLMRPHAAQVIALLRIFELDQVASTAATSKRIPQHIAQIGTGEGKSVILALTVSVLALMGQHVDCACYSKELSQRDYKAFESIFKEFKLDQYISYGIYQELSESHINRKIDVRDKVESLLLGTFTNDTVPELNTDILILDEVDAFYDPLLYMNAYQPTATVSHPAVTDLINQIWATVTQDTAFDINLVNNKAAQLDLQQVKNFTSYNAVQQAFPGWDELFDVLITNMLRDLKRVTAVSFVKDYEIMKNDETGTHEIRYITQGGVLSTAVRGSRTLWSYFLEHYIRKNAEITEEVLKQKTSIFIKCGRFSYAQMIKKYSYISGVSGTLEQLIHTQADLLRDSCHIENYTLVPSAYGKPRLVFDPAKHFKVVIDTALFPEIIKTIDRVIQEEGRAILIFFNSDKELGLFYDYINSTSYKGKVATIRANMHEKIREKNVNNAAIGGKITLATRLDARGTDFVSSHKLLEDNGGLHVLSTIIPENDSEQIQMGGRTARQGNRGSFELLIPTRALYPYGITPEAQESPEAFYHRLMTKRAQAWLHKFVEKKKDLEQVLAEHIKAETFITELEKGNITPVKDYLIMQNAPVVTKNVRVALLLDTTGSMDSFLGLAKIAVTDIFRRVRDILVKNGHESDIFELQVIGYKNYNSIPLLQISTATTEEHELAAFLQQLYASGGEGHEAIEVAFQLLNYYENLKAGTFDGVILMGDASPNSRSETMSKRYRALNQGGINHYGSQSQLVNDLRAIPAYFYDDPHSKVNDGEFGKFRARNIPVDTVYLHNQAKTDFENIAVLTNGRSQYLGLTTSNSKNDLEKIIKIVAERILLCVGGPSLAAQYDLSYVAQNSTSAHRSQASSTTTSMLTTSAPIVVAGSSSASSSSASSSSASSSSSLTMSTNNS